MIGSAAPGRLVSACLLSLLALFLLSGCGRPIAQKQQSYVFGTLVEVTVYGEPEDRARDAINRVLGDFDRLHRTLHAWEPGPLNDLNTAIAEGHADIPAEAGITPLLLDAQRYSEQSGRLFNPAIGNLVRLWGFHSDTFAPRLPPAAEIDRLVRAAPSMADLGIGEAGLRSGNPAVRLDLGGYAKGYALDRAAATLRGLGVGNALINIGGNILALGSHGDRPWKVGIQHPRKAGAIATLELRDGEAIGTSGDYQRYFEVDGRRYCHLIDPRTGWPVQGVQAVTVVARGPHAGTLSDVASKPIFIAGPGDWGKMAARMGIGEVLLIDAGGRATVTAALAARLDWQDKTTDVRITE